ncbi:hypothetical protein MCOR02_008222 [Pyricularia oryzae]|nr:hypothetical protein MCOR02_008222 [Pyricularia oryzae]
MTGHLSLGPVISIQLAHRICASQLSLAAPPNATTTQRSGSGVHEAPGRPMAPNSSPPSASRKWRCPKIVVKKEPAPLSTRLGGALHRTAIDRQGRLGIQEVGLACLSPGFVTQDPVMKEQLQRSMMCESSSDTSSRPSSAAVGQG